MLEIDAPAASADLVKKLEKKHNAVLSCFWMQFVEIDAPASSADLLKKLEQITQCRFALLLDELA